MNDDCLRIALALDGQGQLTRGHFGDAVVFELWDLCGTEGAATRVAERFNAQADDHDHGGHHDHHHGHRAKAQGIIRQLSEAGVQVLVGRAFGANIKRISPRFVPVLVRAETPDEAIAALSASWARVTAAWGEGEARGHVILR